MGSLSLSHWIVLAVIGWWVWRTFFRTKPRPPASATGMPTPSNPRATQQQTAVFAWPAVGDFACEVSGESHYQDALRTLAGQHGKESVSIECIAHLIPEKSNPYDEDAVRVEIEGRTVGYLPKGDATIFRERLEATGLSTATTSCAAEIMGGHTAADGKRMSYGVRLDIVPLD